MPASYPIAELDKREHGCERGDTEDHHCEHHFSSPAYHAPNLLPMTHTPPRSAVFW
jgi:hypothetical protein